MSVGIEERASASQRNELRGNFGIGRAIRQGKHIEQVAAIRPLGIQQPMFPVAEIDMTFGVLEFCGVAAVADRMEMNGMPAGLKSASHEFKPADNSSIRPPQRKRADCFTVIVDDVALHPGGLGGCRRTH